MLVRWEIDIDDGDAATPMEAASLALEIQRDRYSTATVFTVVDGDQEVVIDLDDEIWRQS